MPESDESITETPPAADELLNIIPLNLDEDIENLQPDFDNYQNEDEEDEPPNDYKFNKSIDDELIRKEAEEDMDSLKGWELEDGESFNLEEYIDGAQNKKSLSKKEKAGELNLKKLTNELNKPVDPNVKIITVDPNLQFSSK